MKANNLPPLTIDEAIGMRDDSLRFGRKLHHIDPDGTKVFIPFIESGADAMFIDQRDIVWQDPDGTVWATGTVNGERVRRRR